ncbi:hypothetical protein PFNF54_00146 [Plasmodium falciparum NF54]|nr:hypothetical protein PFNF54_00146 [Plasmodium falciparum NF54]
MQSKRIQCKDRCDKEIQKIILKDKLDKELTEKFATLHTDIQNDAIPTCVCEKSLADKVEKTCLKCTQNLGGIVAPSSGVLGGIGEFELSVWKPAALAAAKEFAEKAGAAQGAIAGNAHGMKIVIYYLKDWGIQQCCPEIFNPFVAKNIYTEVANISGDIIAKYSAKCADTVTGGNSMCKAFCLKLGTNIAHGGRTLSVDHIVQLKIKGLVERADQAVAHVTKTTSETVTAAIKARETALIEGRFESSITSINASIIAIIVIVLILVIIYLILRYRRKKKMKKKLQYLKLLKE